MDVSVCHSTERYKNGLAGCTRATPALGFGLGRLQCNMCSAWCQLAPSGDCHWEWLHSSGWGLLNSIFWHKFNTCSKDTFFRKTKYNWLYTCDSCFGRSACLLAACTEKLIIYSNLHHIWHRFKDQVNYSLIQIDKVVTTSCYMTFIFLILH